MEVYLFKEVKGPFSVYLRYILNKSESATGAQNAILWPPTPHLSPDSRKGLTSVVFSIRYVQSTYCKIKQTVWCTYWNLSVLLDLVYSLSTRPVDAHSFTYLDKSIYYVKAVCMTHDEHVLCNVRTKT